MKAVETVTREEFRKHLVHHSPYTEKMVFGHNVCACEIYDKGGKYIGSAFYERMQCGPAKKTYRIV
jgi:hypothetical protein